MEEPLEDFCVHVSWANGLWIDMTYDLQTGNLGGCHAKGYGPHYYLGPDCYAPPAASLTVFPPLLPSGIGERHMSGSFPGPGEPPVYYYVDMDNTIISEERSQYFFVDGYYQCTQFTYPLEVLELIPLPDEVRYLLDNPPYTLEPAY